MTTLSYIRWVHLLAAAVWTGGLVTMAVLVSALRSAGADRTLLQAAARRFGHLTWTAMAIAVTTGLAQVVNLRMPWMWGPLHLKLGLVGVVILLAAVHQWTARTATPASRGVIQGLILLVSMGIYGAAVHLSRCG